MRAPVVVFLALVMGGGCDNVFNLERVTPPPDAPLCPEPSGHDEDGDRLDDACDLCPGDPDEMPIDTDGDGVGDPCDPTADGSDSLDTFFAFAAPGDFDHWSTLPACSNENEALVCQGADIPSRLVRLRDVAPPLPFAVQLSMTLEDVDRTTYDQIELQANNGSGGPTLRCVLIHALSTSGGTHTESWLANSNAKSVLPNTYSGGTRFVMRMTFRTNQVMCEIAGTRPDGEPFEITATAVPSPPMPGAISMNVQHTSLRIGWISIYRLAP